MTWSLFIDDERYPPRDGRNWKIARTLDETIALIKQYDMPDHISFDHDLGDHTPSGHDIAKAIVDMDLDGEINMPFDFSYYVHSQNPVGRDHIQALFKSYLDFKERTA